MRVAHCELIGRKELNHLKLLLEAGATKWPAVYWNAAARFPGEFTIGDTVDVVYRLGRNSYGGGENLQLTILDMENTRSPPRRAGMTGRSVGAAARLLLALLRRHRPPGCRHRRSHKPRSGHVHYRRRRRIHRGEWRPAACPRPVHDLPAGRAGAAPAHRRSPSDGEPGQLLKMFVWSAEPLDSMSVQIGIDWKERRSQKPIGFRVRVPSRADELWAALVGIPPWSAEASTP